MALNDNVSGLQRKCRSKILLVQVTHLVSELSSGARTLARPLWMPTVLC